jgi:hypothetical protein
MEIVFLLQYNLYRKKYEMYNNMLYEITLDVEMLPRWPTKKNAIRYITGMEKTLIIALQKESKSIRMHD